jgi:FkbM family methyltransferase
VTDSPHPIPVDGEGEFRFRSDSIDQGIYFLVVHRNEYRLPDRFQPDDLVVDIGAHIGAFTYAVLRRGSRCVHAVEAGLENFQIASENLRPYIERGEVALVHGAAWRSDDNDDRLWFEGHPRFQGFPGLDGVVNTGGGSVCWSREGEPVPKVAFDPFMLKITDDGRRRIRLLKLDCEGAEWPILLTSRTLHLVDEICGEFHEIGGQFVEIDQASDPRGPVFGFDGIDRFTIGLLRRRLNEAGFDVTFRRHRRPTGEIEGLGHFFATRPNLTPGGR